MCSRLSIQLEALFCRESSNLSANSLNKRITHSSVIQSIQGGGGSSFKSSKRVENAHFKSLALIRENGSNTFLSFQSITLDSLT